MGSIAHFFVEVSFLTCKLGSRLAENKPIYKQGGDRKGEGSKKDKSGSEGRARMRRQKRERRTGINIPSKEQVGAS